MSSELFLQWLDFYNKCLYNVIKVETKLVETECIKCHDVTFVNHMYGTNYPLCKRCDK